MAFALVIAIVVIAGWIFLATRDGSRNLARHQDAATDSVPVNAYDNPFDTNEANDHPFEPDDCGDASDASSADDSGGCDGDSSSD